MSNGTSTTNAPNPFTTAASAFTPTLGKVAGQEQTLSSWAAPYVTDMLGKTAALSNTPYQTYQGPLTAGYSPLQMQAFQGVGSLAPSQGLGAAQGIASNVASAAGNLGYAPTQFQNQFATPGGYTGAKFDSGFNFAGPGAATEFTNQFKAPEAFKSGSFEGGIFGLQQAQQYMNPFLQQALNPALDEARRQAEISRTQQASRLAQAGAFGGSRQAIMESELNRNLMQAQNKMLGEGYASAYDKAMAQYNQDMARSLQAQQMGEQSRQFGAGQGMQAAQLAAQYGLSAQQAQEAARQFNAGQTLTAAQLQSQFGLDAQKATELSRQFGAQQAMTAAQQAAQYGTEAQRQAEQSRQFGAQYGLQGLAQQLQAAQTLGSLGSAYGAEQRANLAQQLAAGAQQREIEQQGISADLAEFEKQRQFPYQQLQFQQAMLQGLPLSAVNYSYQEPSPFSELLTGAGGLEALYKTLFPTTPTKG